MVDESLPSYRIATVKNTPHGHAHFPLQVLQVFTACEKKGRWRITAKNSGFLATGPWFAWDIHGNSRNFLDLKNLPGKISDQNACRKFGEPLGGSWSNSRECMEHVSAIFIYINIYSNINVYSHRIANLTLYTAVPNAWVLRCEFVQGWRVTSLAFVWADFRVMAMWQFFWMVCNEHYIYTLIQYIICVAYTILHTTSLCVYHVQGYLIYPLAEPRLSWI